VILILVVVLLDQKENSMKELFYGDRDAQQSCPWSMEQVGKTSTGLVLNLTKPSDPLIKIPYQHVNITKLSFKRSQAVASSTNYSVKITYSSLPANVTAESIIDKSPLSISLRFYVVNNLTMYFAPMENNVLNIVLKSVDGSKISYTTVNPIVDQSFGQATPNSNGSYTPSVTLLFKTKAEQTAFMRALKGTNYLLSSIDSPLMDS